MKKLISILLAMALLAALGCAAALADSPGIDYMALVNKQHPLPEGWEEALETVHVTNSVGDDVEVEKKAYDAYLELAAELEQEDGIHIELDSARRSVAAQQDIWDRFMDKYGEEYTRQYVAVPGFSEHHTGLALDLYFQMDGQDVYYNEDMTKEEYLWVWDAVHAHLAEHGFILRYLEGREDITGYGYEPWHIRYLDDPAVAKEIMDRGITLEEYLGEAAPKEAPLFATVGEAMEAQGEDGIHGGYGEDYVVIVEVDGTFVRAVAKLDEQAEALDQAIFGADDIDAAFAARDEYIRTLPILYTEEITAVPKDQAELDALVGKTVKELEEMGYESRETGTYGEDHHIECVLASGLFQYRMIMNESEDEYLERVEDTYVFDDFTVKSASFDGVSFNAVDLAYQADGTYAAPETDGDPFSGNLDLLQIMVDAAQRGELDLDMVTDRLKGMLPEAEPRQAAVIEYVLQMLEGVANQDGDETGEGGSSGLDFSSLFQGSGEEAEDETGEGGSSGLDFSSLFQGGGEEADDGASEGGSSGQRAD